MRSTLKEPAQNVAMSRHQETGTTVSYSLARIRLFWVEAVMAL